MTRCGDAEGVRIHACSKVWIRFSAKVEGEVLATTMEGIVVMAPATTTVLC